MNTAKFEETERVPSGHATPGALQGSAGNGAEALQSSPLAPMPKGHPPTVLASGAQVVIQCAVAKGEFILAAEPIVEPLDPTASEADLEADLHAAVKRAAARFRQMQEAD